MDLNAAQTGFVVAAYALSAIVLAGLVIYTLAHDRALRGKVDRGKEET